MVEEILKQFSTTQPIDLLILLLGVVIGFIVGFLPGLGATQALALLIPLTYGLDPARAMLLLMAVAGSAPTGGSVASILLNTPGEATNVATCWDGYPLTRQGKAGMALGAASTSSFGGAVVGILILMAVLPIGKMLVLSFSYAEFFSIALGGLISLILIEQKKLWKGFISLFLGMVLASVGYDPVTGGVRLSFGSIYLWDGIKLIPALVGLFAISEGIRLVVEEKAAGSAEGNVTPRTTYKDVWSGVMAVFKNFRLFLQSSIIGVIIGIAPAVGGSVGNVLAYSMGVQSTKDRENFGKGDIRGVIAAEAGSNSKGGDLVPTILFGIPGSATMAILLGALMLHGIQPGPRLILENAGVIYALIVSLIISSILVAGLVLVAAPRLSLIPNIPDGLLGTLVIILGIIGGYATNLNYNDAMVAMIFGVVGYYFAEFGYSRVPIVMSLVLGELIQTNFFLTIDATGAAAFFTRPISLVMIILCAYLLARAFKGQKPPKGKVSA